MHKCVREVKAFLDGYIKQPQLLSICLFKPAPFLIVASIPAKIPWGLFLFVCPLAAQSISALSRPPTTAPLNFYLQPS